MSTYAESSLSAPPLSTVNVLDENTLLEADSTRSDDATAESLDLASLTSSIVDYEFENGRRYHAFKAGCYPLPNDENELDRLDLQHHVITLLLNGEYHLAPLRNPSRILDIGTGTGLWAIEMGDKFTTATVVGVDLSPVQPTWVPDNVVFEIDDIENDWLWPENHFDHIHSRVMIGAIGNWKKMIERSFTHCKPGGYLEIQELDPRLLSDDGSVARSPAHAELIDLVVESSEKYGKPVPHHTDFKPWLEQAGFVDVKTYMYKIPNNSWPKDPRLKEIGKYQCLNYTEGYEAISIGLLTRVLGWTYLEFSVFMAKVRKELVNKSVHTYQTFIVAVGRKPYPHEIAARQHADHAMEADTDAGNEEEHPFTDTFRSKRTGEQSKTTIPDNLQAGVTDVQMLEVAESPLFSSENPTRSSQIPIVDGALRSNAFEAGQASSNFPGLRRPIPDTRSRSSGPESDLIEEYSITNITGRPADFPARPRPRNEY